MKMRWMIVFALCLVGCVPERLSGHFGETAFYHYRDHYRVRYAAGQDESRRLLGGSWQLANFELDEAGLPHRVPDDAEHADSHERSGYAVRRRGRALRIARYDLEYRDAETQSLVYARTVPLRHPWTADALPVLMRRTIASLLTPGADAPDVLGRSLPPEALRLRILREGPSSVDGQPAYVIRFVIRIGEQSEEHVTLVGVKAARPLTGGRGVPAMVVFGLVSPPAHHAAGEAALVSLVGRVDLSERE